MKVQPGTGDDGPHVVGDDQWWSERAALSADEQALDDAAKRLAARRRRMPVRRVPDFRVGGPGGEVALAELFGPRRQLIVYHFYACPQSEEICLGCAAFVDNIGNLAHLRSRNTEFVMLSAAPWTDLERRRERMGWTLPWFSTAGTDASRFFGVEDWAGMSFLVRDDDGTVFQTFFTSGADLERLRNDFSLLDMTLLGRQETWEDSPAGWPQVPAFSWWRLHDEYPEPAA